MIKTQVQKFTTFVPKASTPLPTRFCFREYVRTVKEYLIQGYCEQLNQQPCDRCLVTKDSVLAGMLVLHTLLSSRVSADLNLIT